MSPKVTTGCTVGSRAPALHDRLERLRQPLMVFGRLGLIPPDNRPVSGKGRMSSIPNSTNFCTSSGRPLDQGEGNAESRFGWRDTASPVGSGGITQRHGRQRPAPSPTVGRSPGRSRSTRSR